MRDNPYSVLFDYIRIICQRHKQGGVAIDLGTFHPFVDKVLAGQLSTNGANSFRAVGKRQMESVDCPPTPNDGVLTGEILDNRTNDNIVFHKRKAHSVYVDNFPAGQFLKHIYVQLIAEVLLFQSAIPLLNETVDKQHPPLTPYYIIYSITQLAYKDADRIGITA